MDKAFIHVDETFKAIHDGLSPKAVSDIARKLAQELRRAQQARIRSQKAPDGAAWTPRRRRVTRIQERIRFIWNNETRTLKNWHHDFGRHGRTITGWDEDKGGLRTFYREDILRFLEIRTRRINRNSTKHVPMFVKLRTARYLKTKADTSGVTVGYSGVAARIARVHQFGERDQVAPGIFTDYPVRELLGISPADERLIYNVMLGRIAEAVQ
ncbi:phage virion morphogenesis protein [Escherichia coli]|nr:phage virion morphogenesis protein [Escherichia coli]